MQGINNPALNGVRQEQCGPYTRESIEINQHKKKERCIAPEQVVRSVNMFLGEELVSETHLFFCLFIRAIFLKALYPKWE